MKNLLLAILLLGFTNLVCSQNQKSTEALEPLNATYLEQVYNKDAAVKIKKMEELVASYDITKAEDYKSNSTSTYHITFEETNCKIDAAFDKSGTVISTIETFINVKLPSQLQTDIFKNNPNCRFVGNTQTIIYDKENGVKRIYEVQIKQGNEIVSLKLEQQGSIEGAYVTSN